MDVTDGFLIEYTDALLLALQKNNAPIIILFDDYSTVKPEINTVVSDLKFI